MWNAHDCNSASLQTGATFPFPSQHILFTPAYGYLEKLERTSLILWRQGKPMLLSDHRSAQIFIPKSASLPQISVSDLVSIFCFPNVLHRKSNFKPCSCSSTSTIGLEKWNIYYSSSETTMKSSGLFFKGRFQMWILIHQQPNNVTDEELPGRPYFLCKVLKHNNLICMDSFSGLKGFSMYSFVFLKCRINLVYI